jgi:hypothetical protein
MSRERPQYEQRLALASKASAIDVIASSRDDPAARVNDFERWREARAKRAREDDLDPSMRQRLRDPRNPRIGRITGEDRIVAESNARAALVVNWD